MSTLANAGAVIVYWGPTFDQSLTIPNPAPQDGDYFGSRVAIADLTTAPGLELVEASGRTDVGGVGNAGSAHIYEVVERAASLVKTITHPDPMGFNSRLGNGLLVADLIDDTGEDLILTDTLGRAYVFANPAYEDYVIIRKPPAFDEGDFPFGLFMTATDMNADGLTDLVLTDVGEGNLPSCGLSGAEGMAFTALAPHYATMHTLLNPSPHCGDQFGFGGIVLEPGTAYVAAPTDDTLFTNAGHVVVLSH